ncbi:MAG: hypothetical protein FVQ80_15265 [Planctomycetes bacterium]|nr:hypothetical protein [Planctomycetota bacterium]
MKEDRFANNISEVARRSAAVPKRLDIDLSIALTDQPYHISGNLFYIFSAPDESSYLDIKVNETREPVISYSVHTGLVTPFDALYITTPAGQSGTMVLIYGTEAPNLLQIIDNKSTTVAGVGGILDELRGDLTEETWGTEITVGNAAAVQILAANAARKACIIQAKAANTGIVYIGFDNTVTTTKWIAELQAGMSFAVDDYRGDLYARADAAGQLVGYGEW